LAIVAHAASTCSQLSSTSSSRRAFMCAASACNSDVVPSCRTRQRLRHHLRHQRGVGDRLQCDEPRAIGMLVEDFGGELQREPRLADAAGTQQGDQPRGFQKLPDMREVVLAADERRQLLRQIVRRRVERAQRRKILQQIRVQQLIHALRDVEAPQAHHTQLAQ
jgi:hypothetical protein